MFPSGTVTFLFTDLEGSSRLWEQFPRAMEAALAQHDAILREGVLSNRGVIVKSTGDGLHAVFEFPGDAIQATLECQKALLARPWKSSGPLRVRMGLHTGQAQLREGDYYGPVVNRAARVMSVAHGGQVLLSMITAELTRDRLPDGAALLDLGQHRLRSLDRPEQLYQLKHPDLPADFPPLKSLRATPNNLPLQLTGFIGRQQETIELRQLLSPSGDREAPAIFETNPRLVTLTGPGGTGKTRLSLHVAGEILDAFPDGIWLAELAPLSDPELVVRVVAEPMGLQEQPGQPLQNMLANYLRSRKVLLILDNCEHLLDACARLADTLLRSCPRLTILASSREALGIAGEQAIRVRSLSLPEAYGSLAVADLADYDAIQLFVNRAQAVKSSFSLTEDNAEAVFQVCRRLDGIPLAIELAAARARVLTPEQILVRLDDRFRLLTGGSRTALPRQRTLQALIDWSYELLSEQERVLLRRLSVFSGGWTLEAAESVAGMDPLEPYEILDLLDQLVNKSLVLAKETDLGMRYNVLETIRQYAQEKLVYGGEASQLRNRHLATFVDFQEKGSQALLALRAAGWTERLVADNDNLRAAREWALESNSNAALRLMAASTPRWSIFFSPGEGLQFLHTLLDQTEASPEYMGPEATIDNRRLYGRMLVSAAALSLGTGQRTTIDYAERGAAIARELGDKMELVWALTLAGSRSGEMSEAERASQIYQELVTLLPELGPGWVKALVLTSFGLNFVVAMGESVERAWQDWEKGMAMFRQGGELWGLAFGTGMAALAFSNGGDLKKAQEYAERSLALYIEIGDRGIINATRSAIGDLARYQGNLDKAAHYYYEAAEGWRNNDGYGAMSRCLECLAFVYHMRALAAGDDAQNQLLERSATLLGASAAIRLAHDAPMIPREQEEYDGAFALIKEAAGEGDFIDAWQRGQAMDPDQAVAFAAEM